MFQSYSYLCDCTVVTRIATLLATKAYNLPTTSCNWVFGMASGNASCFRRLCVACSYAKANEINWNSLNAVPMNEIPNGWFGPVARVGVAADNVVFAGRKPRGTEKVRTRCFRNCTHSSQGNSSPVTSGYPAIAAGPAAPLVGRINASSLNCFSVASIPLV